MIIFDMDGVLVDACKWHKDALNESLREVCGFVLSEKEHVEHFNGLPTRVKLQKMIKLGYITPEQVNIIYEIKQEKTRKIIIEKAKPREEKVELIKWLKEKSFITCCFTNSIRETALMMLESTGVMTLLDMIVTNQDVEHPKPHPEGYIKILKHFDIKSSEAFIVEDSPRGIKAAYASGCKVLEVDSPEEVHIARIKEFINENFNSNGR